MIVLMTVFSLIGLSMVALLAYSIGFGALPFLVKMPLTGIFAFALGYLVLELLREVALKIQAQRIN